MAKRQAPKASSRKAQRELARLRRRDRQLSRTDTRLRNRDDRIQVSGSSPVNDGTGTSSYPVPLGTSTNPAPLPGTGSIEVLTAGTPDYSWSPESERHAVTTNALPQSSWPPVDLPTAYPGNMGAQDLPLDNGQANPQDTYGGAADLNTSLYYDYNDEAY